MVGNLVVVGVVMLVIILFNVRSAQKKARSGENRAFAEMAAKLLPTAVQPPEEVGGVLTASLEQLPVYPGKQARERDRRFLFDDGVYKLFSIWSYAATQDKVLDEYEGSLVEHGWERHSELDWMRTYQRGDWWLTLTPQTAWQVDMVLWREPAGRVPAVQSGAVYRTWSQVAGIATSIGVMLAGIAIVVGSGLSGASVGWGVLVAMLVFGSLGMSVITVQFAIQAARRRPIAYFAPGSPMRSKGQPAAPAQRQPLVVPRSTKVLEALAGAATLLVVVISLVIWLSPDDPVAEAFTFRTARRTWEIVSAHDIPAFPLLIAAGAYLGVTVAQWFQVARSRGDARISSVVLNPAMSCFKAGFTLYGAVTLWELMRLGGGDGGFGPWPNLLLLGGVIAYPVYVAFSVRRALK